MDIFNIWDLERVNIKISEELLDKINKKLHSLFKSKNKAYSKIFNNKEIPLATFRNILKKSNLKYFFVPLDICLKLCEAIEIPKQTLQKDIIAYKTAGGINFVENPILPIRINPVFDMLLAHNIGGGTVINPGKGRLPYFGYRQFDDFYRVSYIKKIEFVFGKIKFKEDYFLKSTRLYCPPVLSSLFFKYYNLTIKDFLSEGARIPRIIFENKERMLAVLISFIIDEGNIDSTQISIKLKNRLLIEDLNKICLLLNYKSSLKRSNSKDEQDYYRLNILREGMNRFYTDYLLLNKKYPIIDLGRKGEKIKSSFKIVDRKICRVTGNKNLIFEVLKKEQLSVNQLAEKLNMTRQGIRYHIHKLIKDEKIKIVDNKQLNWTYGVE